MNSLDFVIIILLIAFFVIRAKMSFVYYLLGSLGTFIGFIAGIYIVPSVAGQLHSNLKKGLAILAMLVVFSVLGCLAGLFLGNKLRMKVISSGFFKYDKILALPYKIVSALVAIVLLSQTLIYIPILSLQFIAQGSSVFMISNKLFPALPIQTQAEHFNNGQFSHLSLAYDPAPLTYRQTTGAGSLQAVVNKDEASIVKISGRGCTGLFSGSGFVVGDGLVYTDAHVVTGSSTIYIRDHKGIYPATPLIIDNDYDTAILYSKFITDPVLTVAAAEPAVGSPVVLLGYPGAEDLELKSAKVTNQTILLQHKKLNNGNTTVLDNGLGPGSSGGPVLNQQGQVIGANGGGSTTSSLSIAVNAAVINNAINQAKHRIIPTRSSFCAVVSEYY